MTNNNAPLLSEDEVRNMKRDDLRKYARTLGLKQISKLSRDNLNIVVLNEINARRPKNVTRVRTSHAECSHPSTKSARAKCRRERAAKPVEQKPRTSLQAAKNARSIAVVK